ncbi:DUF3368 domain-containing protein [Methylobacterium isbiliense]|uniref:DUF3368 domain-containing protein n=1 Tax=Methylobacterium isbiliense TaxID=315478 RepID=UPI001EE233C8|nr:DUF3368 domain-containing protein [Methylobacterium isbiliense]MDN3622416.1 DUF3368 domain-containing protein [Methylobacterium isbiliense]
MRVVADTGPLNYLLLIGQIDLLPHLFDGVCVPRAVQVELSHRDAPDAVRLWIAGDPDWLTVCPDPMIEEDALRMLDEGERAAIALAIALRADLILMDDRAGVGAARARAFAVTGTLGILDLAARRGLIDLERAVTRLRGTSFRCRPALLDALLDRHRAEMGASDRGARDILEHDAEKEPGSPRPSRDPAQA